MKQTALMGLVLGVGLRASAQKAWSTADTPEAFLETFRYSGTPSVLPRAALLDGAKLFPLGLQSDGEAPLVLRLREPESSEQVEAEHPLGISRALETRSVVVHAKKGAYWLVEGHSPSPGCGIAFPPFPVALLYWVHQRDLAWLIHRPWVVKGKRNTSLTLHPGLVWQPRVDAEAVGLQKQRRDDVCGVVDMKPTAAVCVPKAHLSLSVNADQFVRMNLQERARSDHQVLWPVAAAVFSNQHLRLLPADSARPFRLEAVYETSNRDMKMVLQTGYEESGSKAVICAQWNIPQAYLTAEVPHGGGSSDVAGGWRSRSASIIPPEGTSVWWFGSRALAGVVSAPETHFFAQSTDGGTVFCRPAPQSIHRSGDGGVSPMLCVDAP